MKDTKSNIAVRHCAKRYKITSGGKLFRPDGIEILPSCSRRGYPHIGVTIRSHGIDQKIFIHRIVAYQKYGEGLFETGIVVRHLNHDKKDFRPDNISIGSMSDNYYDHDSDYLENFPIQGSKAARSRRMFSMETAEEIRRRHRNGEGYRKLARAYGCSRSTIRFIVHRVTYAN